MGIVATNEGQLRDAVMQLTLVPLASLANVMGWGWAGGCNSYVGQGFDRTDTGWQAHFDGCDGYMGNKRLGIDYGDWGFDLTDVRWGQPTNSEVTPVQIDDGTLDNWLSDQPKTLSNVLSVNKTATITDTKTSTFNFQSETSITVGYKPPGATGGLEVSGTEKLTFGRTNQEGHTDTTTESVTESVTVQGPVPPYARVPWAVIMSRAMSSVTYTAIFKPRFSVQLKGFLRWGGNDPKGPDTNYHQDYAGKGDRPITDTQPWAKFGSDKVSFEDDLRNKVTNRISPWQWQRLLTQHPDAQSYIDQLTDVTKYQFTITGRVDNVQGTRFDERFGATEYNPDHPHIAAAAAAVGRTHVVARPPFLNKSTAV